MKHLNTVSMKIDKTPDIVLEKNAIEEIIIASKKLNTFGLLAPISNNKKYPNYKINEMNKSINNIEPFKVESIDGFAIKLVLSGKLCFNIMHKCLITTFISKLRNTFREITEIHESAKIRWIFNKN